MASPAQGEDTAVLPPEPKILNKPLQQIGEKFELSIGPMTEPKIKSLGQFLVEAPDRETAARRRLHHCYTMIETVSRAFHQTHTFKACGLRAHRGKTQPRFTCGHSQANRANPVDYR